MEGQGREKEGGRKGKRERREIKERGKEGNNYIALYSFKMVSALAGDSQ